MRRKATVLLLCLMLLVSLMACALTIEVGVIDENDALATAMEQDDWYADWIMTATAEAKEASK